MISKAKQNRVICCHKQLHEPYYECIGMRFQKEGRRDSTGMFVMYTLHYCGNLMHTSCIEKYGKCHKSCGVKEWKDPNEITM